jgi:O-antigen/teichoic acid export membrane protein
MGRAARETLSSDMNRAFWAIADQCAVSGGNFLTNLVLVRTLLPAEFGTYALILNSIVFLNNLQQSVITYPLCVRGARGNERQFRRILGFALFGTALLIVLLLGPGLTLVGLSLLRRATIVAPLLALLCWEMQDTLRSGFLARMQQKRAVVGDALSYGGQALLLGIVCLRAKPSLELIFFTIAGTSLLAFLIQGWQLAPSIPPRRVWNPLVREFWVLGRWSVIAKLLGFLTQQAFPWVLLMQHGRAEVAGFQALFQFLALSNPLLFSIGSMITAVVARHGKYRLRSVRNYLVLVGTVAGTYLVLLGTAGQFVMRLLYGSHSPYITYAPYMRIFAAAWALEIVALLVSSILGGLRKSGLIFVIQFNGAIAAVLIALPWTYWKGLAVAGLGLFVVNLVRAVTGLVLLLRLRGQAGRQGNGPEDHSSAGRGSSIAAAEENVLAGNI